jgi:thiamine biosynthesis protein ThiS
MIEITVNGAVRSVAEGLTLETLLQTLELDPRMVVVERNRVIVRRTALGTTPVQAGDTLEIVHFVGGG